MFFKILGWIILIWFGFQLLWAIFGRHILRFLLGRMTKKMEKNFWQQQNQHQEKYNPDFAKEVNLDRDVKIKVPEQKKRMKNTDAIEDVDFEDVSD